MADTADSTPAQSSRLKEVGGFEIISKLGQGGMGAVFKARQKSLDRIVALKILPPKIAADAKFIERFQREARATAKLNHPNIVQGIDVGKDAATGLWYFAMELVDGPSLQQVLKEQKVMPEARALAITRDIARALDCAAGMGIVHRDIKPDNILLTARGEAKLADLGLAKQLSDDASVTQSGQSVGTPNYMSPEQARGAAAEIDIRTDIYALGGTLFHLVTGQTPFSGETSVVIMTKHLTEPPPKARVVNPAVSEACSRLITRMMQKKREQRVQSPKELIEQIDKILEGGEAEAAEIKTGPRRAVRKETGLFREAQVGELGFAAAGQQDIVGLDVAVNHAVRGDGGQRVSHVANIFQRFFFGQNFSIVENLLQRWAIDQFHRKVPQP
jgi:eukaryotic-like serine/threonine-protein kinase